MSKMDFMWRSFKLNKQNLSIALIDLIAPYTPGHEFSLRSIWLFSIILRGWRSLDMYTYKFIYIYTIMYTYIYICMYMYMCVCWCLSMKLYVLFVFFPARVVMRPEIQTESKVRFEGGTSARVNGEWRPPRQQSASKKASSATKTLQ